MCTLTEHFNAAKDEVIKGEQIVFVIDDIAQRLSYRYPNRKQQYHEPDHASVIALSKHLVKHQELPHQFHTRESLEFAYIISHIYETVVSSNETSDVEPNEYFTQYLSGPEAKSKVINWLYHRFHFMNALGTSCHPAGSACNCTTESERAYLWEMFQAAVPFLVSQAAFAA